MANNFQIPIPSEVLAEITGWHKVVRIEDGRRCVVTPSEARGEELFFQMLPSGFWRFRIMRDEKVVRAAICSGPVEAYTVFEPLTLPRHRDKASQTKPEEKS